MLNGETLKVCDVMSSEVFLLSSSCSVDNGAWALASRGVSGAPVHDRDGKLVGMVSHADLAATDRTDQAAGTLTVGEVMTPGLVVLGPDEPVLEAARLMLAHQIRRLLVVDGRGKLLGIVTESDCLRALVEIGDVGLTRPRRRSPSGKLATESRSATKH